MDIFLEQIGAKLKRERKSRGLNQTNVAKQAGLSRREVSEIENGVFRGSVLKVQSYAMMFGFSITLEKKRFPTLAELPELFSEN